MADCIGTYQKEGRRPLMEIFTLFRLNWMEMDKKGEKGEEYDRSKMLKRGKRRYLCHFSRPCVWRRGGGGEKKRAQWRF